ncbi:MAG: alanine--tRNA ligase [Gemmatimonadaceae bacterium]|nr:alanine--tRNA ligase [Gemmatimonadaceae bacterium]
MLASEIRSRFLAYFERQHHVIRPSSSLVPADDPTLMFTNAGMVQFKRVFLGQEETTFGRRATTSQKCVRAGGKHNDLEQVGHTARHHTFFEMLGNFSFGDYFKRDAIRFAWEFVTEELRIPREHLRVTVFHEDAEARQLWKDVAGVPESRIYGLGAKDNFWQMADTGPCGPCTEIFVDLAATATDWAFPDGATGEWTRTDLAEFSLDAFVEGAEAGRFVEIWNLVFMQFDKQPDGTNLPLPAPSVDTGAGLERIAAVMQGVSNNFHTDVFTPLIAAVEAAVGITYPYRPGAGLGTARDAEGKVIDPASFRVLADHARATAFLLADGVFPANDGRGYVLRRILRRGVRHAWLLGRREPTLVHVVQAVIDSMGDVFPELRSRAKHILDTTRAEEVRFLATIDAGMSRFEELAPLGSTQGSTAIRGTVSGQDVFTLYDTYGFPIDLTELMARERGYLVDIAGFEAALQVQRSASQEDRKSRKIGVGADVLADMAAWQVEPASLASAQFVGYDVLETTTRVAAIRALEDGRAAVILRDAPFYTESGGQVSDTGLVTGTGWTLAVEDVKKVDGRTAVIGTASGTVAFGQVRASVPSSARRDTERNHTATHLLHAALRQVLGDHVHQAGSLVSPDRLRFDFAHHGPVTPAQRAEIEAIVNREIWAGTPVVTRVMAHADAIADGAMALFNEKYGDMVRVVGVGGFSKELCGGTHVRNTAEIGLFVLVHETGVAAGVRRVEALTARAAFAHLRAREALLVESAELLKANQIETVPRKLQALLDERRTLEKRVAEAMKGGGGGLADLLSKAVTVHGVALVAGEIVGVPDMKSLQAMGEALREKLGSGIGVLATQFEDGKAAMVAVVSDDVRARGTGADAIVKALAALGGGRGGGKPHLAQAGLPDAAAIATVLGATEGVVAGLVQG